MAATATSRVSEFREDDVANLTQAAATKGASQVAIILLEEGVGERTILWRRDPRLKYPVEELRQEMILGGRILHLDGCDSEAALQAARWARKAGMPVVIDIDEIYDDSTHELLRNAAPLPSSIDVEARDLD